MSWAGLHDRLSTRYSGKEIAMKTIAFIAAIAVATAAVSAASAPAFAQAQGRFGGSKVTYDATTSRYCFKQGVTGSLIPVTQCRSKAEWAQAGLTISHKSAVQFARR
jgi:opacity protein-like surface antigen